MLVIENPSLLSAQELVSSQPGVSSQESLGGNSDISRIQLRIFLNISTAFFDLDDQLFGAQDNQDTQAGHCCRNYEGSLAKLPYEAFEVVQSSVVARDSPLLELRGNATELMMVEFPSVISGRSLGIW